MLECLETSTRKAVSPQIKSHLKACFRLVLKALAATDIRPLSNPLSDHHNSLFKAAIVKVIIKLSENLIENTYVSVLSL